MRLARWTAMWLAACAAWAPFARSAQEPQPSEGVYVIFDASGSMWGELPDGSKKVETAKRVLKEFVGGDFTGQDLALRVYGHRRKGDCQDSELLMPFGPPAERVAEMRRAIDSIEPLGKTPITLSLRQALADFGDRPGSIILISDGIETCDDDPCELVKAWRDKGVSIKVHVVGLGLEDKAKDAMRCIAEAAGTEFRDANAAATLAEGLREIRVQTQAAVLKLVGEDRQGNPLPVEGVLRSPGGEQPVASNARNEVVPGRYELEVGVRTANGNLYAPVTRTIEVARGGETTVEVEVARPPSVAVRFAENGHDHPGSIVQVMQEGREVFRFRPVDVVFVDEGDYELRARPDPENDLSSRVSVAAGEDRVVTFDLVHLVHVKLIVRPAGSTRPFLVNPELRHGDEVRYSVHRVNGADVLPGTYDLHLPDRLCPFTKAGVVIGDSERQEIVVEVPVGRVTVRYQKADGTPDKRDRCFIGSGAAGAGIYRSSDEAHALLPGTYNVTGWGSKGRYEKAVFEVKEGEDVEVILRALP